MNGNGVPFSSKVMGIPLPIENDCFLVRNGFTMSILMSTLSIGEYLGEHLSYQLMLQMVAVQKKNIVRNFHINMEYHTNL